MIFIVEQVAFANIPNLKITVIGDEEALFCNSPPVDLFCKFGNSSLLPEVSPGVAGAIELGLLPR
jgi:hypothetical protein